MPAHRILFCVGFVSCLLAGGISEAAVRIDLGPVGAWHAFVMTADDGRFGYCAVEVEAADGVRLEVGVSMGPIIHLRLTAPGMDKALAVMPQRITLRVPDAHYVRGLQPLRDSFGPSDSVRVILGTDEYFLFSFGANDLLRFDLEDGRSWEVHLSETYEVLAVLTGCVLSRGNATTP